MFLSRNFAIHNTKLLVYYS